LLYAFVLHHQNHLHKFQSAVNKSQKSVNNFSTSLKQVGGIIAGAFAVDKLLEFGGAIIETTGEFERFEAVLTNTLGSKSQAQKALNDITEFASKTPFSVLELTDSFVRLANQGFRPTRNLLVNNSINLQKQLLTHKLVNLKG
jgi:phage tail tape-measure protein